MMCSFSKTHLSGSESELLPPLPSPESKRVHGVSGWREAVPNSQAWSEKRQGKLGQRPRQLRTDFHVRHAGSDAAARGHATSRGSPPCRGTPPPGGEGRRARQRRLHPQTSLQGQTSLSARRRQERATIGPPQHLVQHPALGGLCRCVHILRGVRKEHLDRGRTPPSLTLATRRITPD